MGAAPETDSGQGRGTHPRGGLGCRGEGRSALLPQGLSSRPGFGWETLQCVPFVYCPLDVSVAAAVVEKALRCGFMMNGYKHLADLLVICIYLSSL